MINLTPLNGNIAGAGVVIAAIGTVYGKSGRVDVLLVFSLLAFLAGIGSHLLKDTWVGSLGAKPYENKPEDFAVVIGLHYPALPWFERVEKILCAVGIALALLFLFSVIG